MSYVDGFAIPVPTANRDVFRDHEAMWWPFFRDRTASPLTVYRGEAVQAGKQTDFLRAAAAPPDETVAFGWMTWPDKATRNAPYEKTMKTAPDMTDMPFGGKRMIRGGFEPILMEGRTQ